MKMIRFSKYVALVIILASVFGCDDAEMKAIDNGLYIQEAAPSNKFDQQIITQLVDDEEVVKTLTVRLVRAMDHDVTVTLDIDPQLLEDYNNKNEANYLVLPEEYRNFEKTVTISAGNVSAPVIDLTIKPYSSSNGEAYAIPIRITSVDGPVEMKGNANHLLYLLTSPHRQKAVIIKRGNRTTKTFSTAIPMEQWTFEYWVKVDNITGSPTGDWEGLENKNFRARIFVPDSQPLTFSDLTLRYYADGANVQIPILQFQNSAGHFDTTGFWWPDTWYHIAYTYDGTTVTVYKDGVKDNSLANSIDWTFKSLSFAIGSFGYEQQVEFAQIRMWKKCLSENVIKDNMSRQVAGDSDGLIGYWKCDEGTGNELKDSSPNQNHVTLGGTPQWSEQINFSHPNK
ncbi:BT_3987 domain-containing protein [Bacteroides difficilis]|uniref:BT_3987 domain-containing protein n=1 Tax=Bacteroides difficilis TaxID=2763021 RepID=UPI003AAFD385